MKHRITFEIENPTPVQARWLRIVNHMTPHDILMIGETMEQGLTSCVTCFARGVVIGKSYETNHGEGMIELHTGEEEECPDCEGTGTKLNRAQYRRAFAVMMGEED